MDRKPLWFAVGPDENITQKRAQSWLPRVAKGLVDTK